MSAPAGHIHVTEREADGSWEDCTWCSGLEWHRLFHNLSTPATHAEMQALRAASGEPTTGGSSIADLRRGIAARYGYTPPPAVSGFSVLWTAMNGRIAVVQGSMKAFSSTNHYSRWDPSFDGGHAVFAYRPLNEDRVWWCDPEAPSYYQGEWMSKSDLSKYVYAFPGQHLIGPVHKEAITMAQAAHTDETPRLIDIPDGAAVYDLDGVTKLGTTTAKAGRYSPFAIAGGYATYSGTFGSSRVVRIIKAATNVRPVPDATPYSAIDLTAAKTSGTIAERSRIRSLLGL